MAITVTVPAALRDWIVENLRHGSPPTAMIEALVAKKIEPRLAQRLVETFAAQAAGTPMSQDSTPFDLAWPESEYQYETPRISQGHTICAGGHEVRVLQRLERPVVVTLERVMTDAECAQLIDLARPRLQPSTIVDRRTGTQVVADRNSDGMFFGLHENPFIARLDERISALMNRPVENGEGLQVLHYGPGGQYPPHFDFLIPRNTPSRESIARSGQRVSTLIVYLNDVPEGGETVFPAIGLSVSPRRGNAVYFEYTNSRSQVDPRSLHAGAPVTQGEKWVVTKWMRSQRFIPAGTSPY